MKVTAIVPVYNEEKYIHFVLKSLTVSSLIDEIICVNDGSTDKTISIVQNFNKVKLINLKKNYGKGYAVAKGVDKATGEIILFIDGDKKGFTDYHFQKFITPLKTHRYRAVIGYLTHIRSDKIFRPLSGDRAYFKQDIVPHMKNIRNKGYGIELYLNYAFRDKKVKLFPLSGVKHALKHQKQTYDTVAKLLLTEGFDIFVEILRQENPVSYMMKSYLHAFYLPKNNESRYLDRLTRYIRLNVLNKLK